MQFDQTFWVGLSFVIFILLVAKPLINFIITSLDNRSKKIQMELDEALHLKEEAQALLASYKRKEKEIADEAKKIVEHAKKEAELLKELAQKEMDESLNKKIEMSMQKIATYEASVINEIRNNVVDVAVSAAREVISSKMSSSSSNKLFDSAIVDISKKL